MNPTNDPSSRDAPPATPNSSTARYRAGLRRACLRRRGPGSSVLHAWWWLLPRVSLGVVLGLPAFLAPALGAEVAPSMPVRSTSDFCPPGVSGPSQEGVVIVISKTQILVGDDPNAVVRLPSREQFVQSGLDTAYKANGPSDLFIVPLAAALSHARKEDQAARKAQCLEASTSEAIIVADATTPYRLLSEVLFTLGQTGFGKHHLMVRSGRKRK